MVKFVCNTQLGYCGCKK